MTIFRLAPDSGAARAVPSLPAALVYGALSFGAVSTLAYTIWAFRLVPGTAGLYTTTALVYLGLGGLALSRLVVAPGAWKRFPPCFALVFLAYAAAWCVFWFGLRGRYQADLWGAVVGLAAATWLLQRAFGATRGFLVAFVVLFLLHSAGYYAGEQLYAAVGRANGRLLWGAAHGLGFGAGLGYVLWRLQAPRAAAAASAPAAGT
ncbi:MAG: hypothetical protein JNL39_06645 [Opitutaceae bacterium]|nr:hypothetical protein [Opitutaceae bacterium]